MTCRGKLDSIHLLFNELQLIDLDYMTIILYVLTIHNDLNQNVNTKIFTDINPSQEETVKLLCLYCTNFYSLFWPKVLECITKLFEDSN